MTSSPLKRKNSSPVVLRTHQRRASHTNIIKLVNPFDSTPIPIHHYPSRNIRSNQPIKKTAEHIQTGATSIVDHIKGNNGSSVQRSVELPKLFSGKVSHPVFQHVDDCDLKFEEIPMNHLDIFKPRLLLALDKDVQAQRLHEASSVTSSAQFAKTNLMKSSYPSSKALVIESQSKNGSQLNLFQSMTTAPTPTDNDRKKKFGGSNINKKIQEVMREPSDSSIGSLEASDKPIMIKELVNTLPAERNTKFDDLDDLDDEEICEDLAKGKIVKTETEIGEKVRIYRRHTDASKHFYGQQTSHKLKKTCYKKSLVLVNSAVRNTEKSSIDNQKSFLAKSYNVGLKRSMDLSSISVNMNKNPRLTTSNNGTPSMILDKVNFNATGSSIQVLENGHYQTEADAVTHNVENAKKGTVIKTRFLNTKGKSMMNLVDKPDVKITVKTMLNIDTKDKDSESAASKPQEITSAMKLGMFCKDAIKEEPVKRTNYLGDEDVPVMTQRSVMKGISTKPCLLIKTLPKETEEIHNQIGSLIKKVDQHQTPKVTNNKKVLLRDFIKKDVPETTGYLNELDMQAIRDEYRKKDADSINYERLDSVILRLDFFAKLSKPVRLSLLRNATHAYYPSGSTIIRKGEFGDQMYVILRGSVNVRALKTMKSGQRENITVAVLYDGAHFGEYTLVRPQDSSNKDAEYKICTHMGMLDLETGKETSATKKQTQKAMAKKVYVGSLNDINEDTLSDDTPGSLTNQEEEQYNRTANVEVSESCDLLCIPRQQFQNIFLDLVQKELDAKLKLLLSVPLFVRLDPFGLIPLANNLIPKVYKMGEVIISAGQEVQKFNFISQGRCKVTLRSLRAADIKSDKNRLNGPRRRNLSGSNFVVNKVFDQEPIEAKDGKLYYADHIEYGTLGRGHIIGGRSLLSEADLLEEEEEDQDLAPVTDFYLGPARLSVIAESPIVEVYELDMEHLASVPAYLLKIMRRGLKRMTQFDDFDVEKEKREHEEWNRFKDNEVSMVVKSKPKNPDSDPKA